MLWLLGVRFVHLGASAWPVGRPVDQAMCLMHVLCIFGFPHARSNDHMSHKSLPGGFPSILPKSVLKFDFVKKNSFDLSKHIWRFRSERPRCRLRVSPLPFAVALLCPFCASWGFVVAGRPISRSNDPESWVLDLGFWVLDPGFWVLGCWSWVLDLES